MTEPVGRGVFPVFQTPFGDDESIDFAQLEQEVRWIAEQGAHGVVFGMVSEALRLSDRERADVIRVASGVAAEYGLPCIASVGGESTAVALLRVADAIEAGASALMATPPLHGRNGAHQLEEYFRAILARSSVPIVVQDASGYVGQSLSIEMQAQLFSDFGSHAKFKPEAVPVRPTLDALLAATGGRAEVYEGMGGAALLDTYPGGVSGSMPGAEVCWAVVAMWNALEAGDQDAAEAINRPLVEMIALQDDLDSFVVCEKFLLVEQGVLSSRVARTPLGFTLEPAAEQRLRGLLDELRRAVQDARSVHR
ncbi:dihydrodipicolinate synthase family protein [Amnibacterium sp. CER49]|uniref:dihydrodipicolinate synthase family protein n=1 Tax=Amnibacterium sp. CER49 TaxID=3039161 RepID=UPI0024480EB9|nr:dihydrodipicolinate synthase family protein [Amnibacterium sp. CER49]MDH2443336.1 dihydrodipicolinate synthase family protein [Amnibacterium sp. CER49]